MNQRTIGPCQVKTLINGKPLCYVHEESLTVLGAKIDVPVIMGCAPHNIRRGLHDKAASLAPSSRHRIGVQVVAARTVAVHDRITVIARDLSTSRGARTRDLSACRGARAWGNILLVSCRRRGRVRCWSGGMIILSPVRCSTIHSTLSASAIVIQKIATVLLPWG